MATLYIAEFTAPPSGTPPVLTLASWITDQTVAIGASSASSEAFNEQTAFILVASDVACSVIYVPPGERAHRTCV